MLVEIFVGLDICVSVSHKSRRENITNAKTFQWIHNIYYIRSSDQ